MVVVKGKKFACSTCIKGHRSSSCNHVDRPLFAIRAKGRPVSQCEHCRELRKTKQVHVKCECDTKPSMTAIPDSEGQPVVARKGARKVKTLETQKPTFPNGIQDMAQAELLLEQFEAMEANQAYEPGCTCKDNGTCTCCTDRYIPRHARGDSSTAGPSSSSFQSGHGHRPSISLEIPHTTNGGPASPTPGHGRRGSRSHSRSPSRTSLHSSAEGHIIGGSPNEHRQHAMHYTPYPTMGQSPSSAISPSHLAPPGIDGVFAFGGSDVSVPSSPLSDYDRSISGRNTPFDYSNLPGTPTHPPLFGPTINAMQGMSLAGDGTATGAGSSNGALDQLLNAAMGQSLSPVSAFGQYRQSQQDSIHSPISPQTPQFLSPTESSAQTSPTSYAPLGQAYNSTNVRSAPADPFAVPTTPLDMSMMAANFGNVATTGQYADVFEAGEADGGDFWNGNRSRRGSHQSVASSHSGHGGNYLQANAATSPYLSASAPISAHASPNMDPIHDLGDINTGLGMLGQEDGGSNVSCSSGTKGCNCMNLDGTLKPHGERCALDNCPCCARRNFPGLAISLFDTAVGLSGSGYAVSTEREGANSNSSPVMNSSLSSMTFTGGLQIPIQAGRSRSSSQSSNVSTTSYSSLSNEVSGMNLGGAPLGRANSTGQIGRGKYKHIAPKPTHHNTEPLARLGPAQQGFSFPRNPTAGSGPTQPSPAVIVTEHQSSESNDLDRIFQTSIQNSAISGDSLFSAGGLNQTQQGQHPQPFVPKPMFEFSNVSAMTGNASDIRHSRHLSHPINLQTSLGASLSGPPSPHPPRSPVQFGDPTTTGSGSNPASPLLRHPSSPSPNSPLLTHHTPPSPSQQQPPPMITISHGGHGRSQSSSNAGLLEPKPMYFSHHSRSASTSFLDPMGRSLGGGFPSVIITPASPHPGSSSAVSGQQQ